jgi:hypothetical protein
VSIRHSSSADVSRLIGELSSPEAFRRDTAAARLAVIGARAVSRLITVAGDPATPVDARAAALAALGAMGDARATGLAMALLDDPTDALALGAIDVLTPVARGRDANATRAFDRLAGLALSTEAPVERRLAAIAALEGQPDRLMKPVYEALLRDPASRVVARVVRRRAGVVATLDELVEAGLPDDPALVDAVVREDAGTARVTRLRSLVEALRQKEQERPPSERPQWMTIRGQVHRVLAERGSRLALYDLREALERTDRPLPVGFLAAAATIGDVTCLEPLAAGWVAAAGTDRWWRDHLAEAFRAIVTREAIKRGHPVMRRVLERWPSAGVLVAAGRR